jgi:murein L,D-transpeptidase YcbB/YkuD
MPVRRFFLCGLVILLSWSGTAARRSPPIAMTTPVASAQAPRLADDEMRQRVLTTLHGGLTSRPLTDQRDLTSLYGGTAGAPVWLEASGRPSPRAQAGLAILQRAAADGLDPADYGTVDLAARATSLAGAAPVSTVRAAEFDVALSAAVLRYLRHLHLGRLDPRRLGWQIAAPVDADHDFAAILREALDQNRLAEVAEALGPPLFQYRSLREMLKRYRQLAAESAGLAAPTLVVPIRAGDPCPSLPFLRRLLESLGDLPAATPLPVSGIYDAAMAEAVARFQARHGLETDGVIGRATAAALRVPLAWRVRQIELALERLRWLPDLTAGPLVAVNIPMFRLWAWSSVPSSAPPDLSMGVIVGRALNTRTPVFADEMEHLIFRPYWNVPSSILRNESLPAIRADLSYVAREDMEIVDGPADASPVLAPTEANVARLGRGGVRLRQRPGPGNALGLVKFMFPNLNDVYMHGTPARQLFRASRRDFSHGCIRVEDPVALAHWALRDKPDWTRDRIWAAMNGAPNQRVNLGRPVSVVIFYTTAVVTPEDGLVHFAEDIYRQDAALDVALRTASSRSAPPRESPRTLMVFPDVRRVRATAFTPEPDGDWHD